MKKFLLTISILLPCLNLSAEVFEFSYNFENLPSHGYGNSKTETFDVAIHIDNPSLIGLTIKGVKVPLSQNGISQTSAWVSSELNLVKKNGKNVNSPDMLSQHGDVTDGCLEIYFDQPCIVPEGGCYVGYSFTVDELNDDNSTPVAVVDATHPSGLFLHSSRTKLRWGAMSEDIGAISAMSVILDGNVSQYALCFSSIDLVGAAGDQQTVYLPIVNCGSSEVSRFSYSYSVGDISDSGVAMLDTPLAPHIAARGVAPVSVKIPDSTGQYNIRFSINSIENVDVEPNQSSGILTVYPFLPVCRPLIEEYTALWCGWCPRGYVALETMKELKGDLFIAAAYHSGDDMALNGSTPNSPDGYPSAYVNRNVSVNIGNIYSEWDTFRHVLPDADLDVDIEWVDDSHSALKTTADVRFVKDFDNADFRVNFLLIADNLSDPNWRQHNSYAPTPGSEPKVYPEMPGDLGKLFTEGEAYVSGLIFNDVVIATTDYEGIRGAIPDGISVNESYPVVYTFSLDGIKEKLLSQPDYLRVIAVLIDGKSGKVVNCNSSDYVGGSPFAYVDANVDDSLPSPIEIARYLLDGTPVDHPVKGVNIIKYSDGSVRKIFVN